MLLPGLVLDTVLLPLPPKQLDCSMSHHSCLTGCQLLHTVLGLMELHILSGVVASGSTGQGAYNLEPRGGVVNAT
jgi:hypothetical protein